jgi:propanol-preferring alcohol dehydrogenase
VAKGIRILTSAVGTRQDLREVLGLAAAGKIHTVAATCRLDDLNEVFGRMQQGKVSGRVVLEFP